MLCSGLTHPFCVCAQAKFGELGFDIRPSKQAAAERAALAQLNVELKKSTSLADEAVATLHVRQTEHAAEVARLNQVLYCCVKRTVNRVIHFLCVMTSCFCSCLAVLSFFSPLQELAQAATTLEARQAEHGAEVHRLNEVGLYRTRVAKGTCTLTACLTLLLFLRPTTTRCWSRPTARLRLFFCLPRSPELLPLLVALHLLLLPLHHVVTLSLLRRPWHMITVGGVVHACELDYCCVADETKSGASTSSSQGGSGSGAGSGSGSGSGHDQAQVEAKTETAKPSRKRKSPSPGASAATADGSDSEERPAKRLLTRAQHEAAASAVAADQTSTKTAKKKKGKGKRK